MTKNQANAIYDILVEHCGAPAEEDARIPFVDAVMLWDGVASFGPMNGE